MCDHETCLKPSLYTGVEVAGVYAVFPIPALLFPSTGRARIHSLSVSKGPLQVLVHLLYQSVALVSLKGQRQRYRRMKGNLGTTLQLMFCVAM